MLAKTKRKHIAVELLSIEKLKAGHVVASAVTNKGGAVLVPPGFKLTEPAIERLRNAGVEGVIVEETRSARPDLDLRIAGVAKRFEGIDDPIMLQLKATILRRLNMTKLECGA